MFFQKINSFLNCVYEGMMSNMSPIAWTLYCSDHSMAANNEYNEIWEILDRTQLSKHNKYFATTNTRERVGYNFIFWMVVALVVLRLPDHSFNFYQLLVLLCSICFTSLQSLVTTNIVFSAASMEDLRQIGVLNNKTISWNWLK